MLIDACHPNLRDHNDHTNPIYRPAHPAAAPVRTATYPPPALPLIKLCSFGATARAHGCGISHGTRFSRTAALRFRHLQPRSHNENCGGLSLHSHTLTLTLTHSISLFLFLALAPPPLLSRALCHVAPLCLSGTSCRAQRLTCSQSRARL